MVSGRTACAEAVNDGAIRGLPNLGSGCPPKELTSEPSEAVMVEGESISEFVSRGLRSRDEARRTGDYVDADVVVDGPRLVL